MATTLTLIPGQVYTLFGNQLMSNDQAIPSPTSPLIWTVDDQTVVDFLSANDDRTQIQIKALKAGSVTITLSDGTHSTTLAVTVNSTPAAPTLTSLEIVPQHLPGPTS